MCPGPGFVLCRQELEERCLLKVCQTWEERAEEHLTMKQEEGEGGLWGCGGRSGGRITPLPCVRPSLRWAGRVAQGEPSSLFPSCL